MMIIIIKKEKKEKEKKRKSSSGNKIFESNNIKENREHSKITNYLKLKNENDMEADDEI